MRSSGVVFAFSGGEGSARALLNSFIAGLFEERGRERGIRGYGMTLGMVIL